MEPRPNTDSATREVTYEDMLADPERFFFHLVPIIALSSRKSVADMSGADPAVAFALSRECLGSLDDDIIDGVFGEVDKLLPHFQGVVTDINHTKYVSANEANHRLRVVALVAQLERLLTTETEETDSGKVRQPQAETAISA